MELTPEQKAQISSWLAEGASVATVQQRISEHFQQSLTYMETRFLLDDLNLELKSPPKPPTPPAAPAKPGPATPAAAELVDEDEPWADEADFAEPAETGQPPAGGLSLEVDRLTRPGAVVSGSVVFSDGVKAKWALDQAGRLMLEAGQPGYQPSAADVRAFQAGLQRELQKLGY
jgi:hypothetical protein